MKARYASILALLCVLAAACTNPVASSADAESSEAAKDSGSGFMGGN